MQEEKEFTVLMNTPVKEELEKETLAKRLAEARTAARIVIMQAKQNKTKTSKVTKTLLQSVEDTSSSADDLAVLLSTDDESETFSELVSDYDPDDFDFTLDKIFIHNFVVVKVFTKNKTFRYKKIVLM